MSQEINVVALEKGKQRFVFLYDDASTDKLLQILGECASDPEIDFSWHDAATLSRRVRAMSRK